MKKTRRGTKRETAKREEQERTRNKRVKAQRGTECTHERQAKRGINERGGERKATLTHTHTHRVSEGDLGEAGRQ